MAEKELPNYVIDTKRDRATGIRIPADLHARINEKAEAKYRTFNSMLVAMLQDSIEKPEPEVMFLRVYRKLLEMQKQIDELAKKLNKGEQP